ncbi:MAG: hypothetical protein ABID38_01815 [Candidatus Diapherotrites archaeon]
MDEKEMIFKFCPKCGSKELKTWVNAPDSISAKMVCNFCNTINLPFEGTAKFISKFKKRIESEKK